LNSGGDLFQELFLSLREKKLSFDSDFLTSRQKKLFLSALFLAPRRKKLSFDSDFLSLRAETLSLKREGVLRKYPLVLLKWGF